MSDDAVTASAKGATFLILLQIGSRAATFALNQFLLRFLSPGLLGVAVQLELYVQSTLYFSRESLRIATQRRSDGGVQAAINLSYLALAAGAPIGYSFGQQILALGSLPDVPYVHEALKINHFAAMIELLGEPGFVAVQQNMLYKVRAAAEAVAVVMKTLTTAGLVFWSKYRSIDLGVLPFAAGELAYSASLTLVYCTQTIPSAWRQGYSLLPQKMESSATNPYLFSIFSKPLLYLGASLYMQTGIKWLLTEGDKVLIVAFASSQDQGMYSICSNYGGLIARMLFRPIEDSSRNLFAKLCAATSGDDAGAKGSALQDKLNGTPKLDEKPEAPATPLAQAEGILRNILRVYSIASLIVFAIGPTAAPLLLQIVAGSRWADSGAGEVLSTYCYCIPLLAINGVSEAFVAATASTKQLQRQSVWMGLFSAGFAASAYVFLQVLQLGAKGLVLANCINMAMRIVFNLNYAGKFFAEHGVDFNLLELLPSVVSTAGAAVVLGGLSQSQLWAPAWLARFGVVGDLVRIGAVGAMLAAFVGFVERKFLMELYKKHRG